MNSRVWIMLALLALPSVIAESQDSAKQSKIIKIDSHKIVYRVYAAGQDHALPLDDIELWDEIPFHDHPRRFFYDGEPDFRIKFLEKGFARLRNPPAATQDLIAAETRAKAAQLGMWAPPPPKTTTVAPLPEPPSQARAKPPSQQIVVRRPAVRPPPEPQTSIWTVFGAKDGRDAARRVWSGIIVIGGAIGLYEIWGIFWRWRRRYRVDVILVGHLDVGKTWLWSRLLHPHISEEELRRIKRTLADQREALPPMLVGDYVIKPRYRDMPGSHSGRQLAQLLDRRKLWWLQNMVLPQKRIWIIFLSPNTNAKVTLASPLAQKLDHDHMQQQYGSLLLYEAALREARSHKPALVIVAVTMADLFLEDEPDIKSTREATAALRQHFVKQTVRLQKVCDGEHVKCEVVLTSALCGWGTRQIIDAIGRVFHKMAAR